MSDLTRQNNTRGQIKYASLGHRRITMKWARVQLYRTLSSKIVEKYKWQHAFRLKWKN